MKDITRNIKRGLQGTRESTAANEEGQRSSLKGPLFIYGAYGRTGSLVARVALERGHEVVLAGADRSRLDRLSVELGAPGAQIKLDSPLALRQLVRNAACVIHAAGPFATTFRPMLEACCEEGIPYVDLNGELDVFRALEDFTGSRRPEIPVVPGVGFGVAAGESVAMHAAALLTSPERIWLGLAPDLGQRSPGALRSTLRTVAQGGSVIEDGQFVSERVGRRSFQTQLTNEKRSFVSMPLGELWAIRRSTGARSILAGATVPMAERILLQTGTLGLLGRSEHVRNWLVKFLAKEPDRGEQNYLSLVWAQAQDRAGNVAEALLTMGEGYLWSAEAAVRAAERVVRDPRPGLWSAGQYFGKEFALEVRGTRLSEIVGPLARS